MKKSPLKRIGKIGRANLLANKRLKELFRDIQQCEIGLEGCMRTWPLQFCHRHRRLWYKGNVELLSDWKQVLCGCQNCHEKIDKDSELLEKVFKRLRDGIK